MVTKNKLTQKRTLLFILCSICMFLLMACGKKEPVLFNDFTEASLEEDLESQTEVHTDQKNVEHDSEIQKQKQTEGDAVATEHALEVKVCYVHICGAVLKPGVYQMPAESRMYQAIAMAGGFREDACTEYFNQAELVIDGEQIKIPTITEAKAYERQPTKQESEKVQGVEKQKNESGLININTADANTLCTLPGIGSLKATNIIAFREQNGGFSSIEDILQVEGIKNGTYNKLKDKITI